MVFTPIRIPYRRLHLPSEYDAGPGFIDHRLVRPTPPVRFTQTFCCRMTTDTFRSTMRSELLSTDFSGGKQVPDRAMGIVASAWVLTQPTPGNVINTAAPVAATSQLAVNEFLAQPAIGSQWLELANRDAALPAAINGVYVQAGSMLQRVRMLAFIPPGGYLLLPLQATGFDEAIDLTLPRAIARSRSTDLIQFR
jgi:hypothetical protein